MEWSIATPAAQGVLIPRHWIDHTDGEEEISILQEELLPAMALFLAQMDAIERAREANQEARAQADQAL